MQPHPHQPTSKRISIALLVATGNLLQLSDCVRWNTRFVDVAAAAESFEVIQDPDSITIFAWE